jgi:hypothetical protein
MRPVNSNGDRDTNIYTYLSRRSLMNLIGLSTFGMGLWMSGCDHRSTDSALTTDVKKEDNMESVVTIKTSKTSLPSLDTAAPAVTKTATFALG